VSRVWSDLTPGGRSPGFDSPRQKSPASKRKGLGAQAGMAAAKSYTAGQTGMPYLRSGHSRHARKDKVPHNSVLRRPSGRISSRISSDNCNLQLVTEEILSGFRRMCSRRFRRTLGTFTTSPIRRSAVTTYRKANPSRTRTRFGRVGGRPAPRRRPLSRRTAGSRYCRILRQWHQPLNIKKGKHSFSAISSLSVASTQRATSHRMHLNAHNVV